MTELVFDTGALIALERGDAAMWRRHARALSDEDTIHVPTTVLAQAWRGGRAQARLATALRACQLAPFDDVAYAVGLLLGTSRTHDIVDAHVAIVAVQRGDVLFTSDPDDLGRLIAACGGRRPRLVEV